MQAVFPPLRLGRLTAPVPVVQGGMGVGVSLSGLAAAVANEGGVGLIASVGIGGDEPDFDTHYAAANRRALVREVRAARAASDGIIGVNIMVTLSDFDSHVAGAVEAGADLVFLGAGLPTRLPEHLPLEDLYRLHTQFVPIVSSGRAARLVLSSWLKRYRYLPPAVVVEGPLAGGHLGFSREQIADPAFALEKLIEDVLTTVAPFQKGSRFPISVIGAGGIWSGADIHQLIRSGAQGAQMATRFVTTRECDADDRFKQAHLDCTPDDLQIIDSPAGLPGRAIANAYLGKVSAGRMKPAECRWNCLRSCNPATAPYCIGKALLNARKGLLDEGFPFAGAHAYRAHGMTTVPKVFQALREEYAEGVSGARHHS